MAGLKYAGTNYSSDGNVSDVLSKNDVDTEFSTASVSQSVVQGQINTSVATYASQTYVNNALSAFVQSNVLVTQEAGLIPITEIGVPGGLAPLDNTGHIPSEFVPSLGVGYCLGPFGPTASFSGTTGATPLKIADWSIGPPGISFQPMVFMSSLVTAASGGRPVIEVRLSAGAASYTSQTLVARGVGRNNWNDLQAITVLPVPAQTGHTGVVGSGYLPTYNLWLSAWLYDANSQSVTIETNNIASGACFLMRYQQ